LLAKLLFALLFVAVLLLVIRFAGGRLRLLPSLLRVRCRLRLRSGRRTRFR